MKKILILTVLAIFIATGAFAELAIGVSGALNMSGSDLDDANFGSMADRFQKGDGIFYGAFVELLGRKAGLGLAFNASFYDAAWGAEMVDMDITGYLNYHLFKTTSFIDPFAEIGFGYIFKDFADSEESDWENPVTAAYYWYGGAGLGINLGFIGVFAKFQYQMAFPDAVKVNTDYIDNWGNPQTVAIELEKYAVQPYKVVIGAKLIL